jgi:hypothetical protein
MKVKLCTGKLKGLRKRLLSFEAEMMTLSKAEDGAGEREECNKTESGVNNSSSTQAIITRLGDG